MRRLRDLAVLTGVACGVTSSAYVLGQVQKAAAPPAPIVVRTQEAYVGKAKPAATKADAKQQAQAKRKTVVQGKVVMKAAVMLPARIQAAAVLDAQAAQFVQQFRPLFRTEYYFIRGTCDLTPDQRRQLAELGERAVKATAREFADAQQKMMLGGWRPGARPPDAQKLLEQELIKATASFLKPEQQHRYKDEVEKRAASRRQVAVDNVVARIDQDLVLTSDQRRRLAEALVAHWDDSWVQSLDMLMNVENFLPNIPDDVVAPILSESQRNAWRRIPKNQGMFWGVNFGGMVMENDPLDDPELIAARKHAEDQGKRQRP
jgi:hypothetical protein